MNNNSQYVCNFTKNRKLNLISVFHGKCGLCGFDDFPEALEFHHVDPSQKSFQLSSNNMKSLAEQLKEAKKCFLVCSNCHKGIHAGHLKVPENYTDYYDEQIAQYLLDELQKLKENKKHYCKDCNKLIWATSIRCKKCSQLAQRKQKRPSKEELLRLIKTQSFTSIGKLYDVSDNTIRKWCRTYNLPTNRKELNELLNQK